MTQKSIETIEKEIAEEFSIFDTWEDKYEYIIELGRNLPLISQSYKDDTHKVSGCQSQVWVNAEFKNGFLELTADSDAIITKGIIALIIRVLGNQKPEDIVGAKMEFIETIGLKQHLSMNRANGLAAMINRIKSEAKKFINEVN